MLIQYGQPSVFCILTFGLNSEGIVKEFYEVFQFEGKTLRGYVLGFMECIELIFGKVYRINYQRILVHTCSVHVLLICNICSIELI